MNSQLIPSLLALRIALPELPLPSIIDQETAGCFISGSSSTVEVFFKTCKSLLRLTKGCRSISYDAMSVHTAIVFARYMFLATETRSDKDDRTVGPLFCIISEELAEISVSEAFEKIQLFLTKLLREFIAPVDEICAVFSSTIAELPECLATALEKYKFSLTSRAALVCEV